jgi:hypothetical protein
MKKIKNESLVNTTNQTSQEKNETGFQTNQLNVSDNNSNKVNNPLFRLVEERYNIKIENNIFVCINSIYEKKLTNNLQNVVKIIPFRDTLKFNVTVVDVKDKYIKTVDDIYAISSTGCNSSKHLINQGDTLVFFSLSPIIKLVRNNIEHYTNIDTPHLRDIFYHSEDILNGNKDNSYITREDLKIKLAEYYLEDLDKLDKIFNVKY